MRKNKQKRLVEEALLILKDGHRSSTDILSSDSVCLGDIMRCPLDGLYALIVLKAYKVMYKYAKGRMEMNDNMFIYREIANNLRNDRVPLNSVFLNNPVLFYDMIEQSKDDVQSAMSSYLIKHNADGARDTIMYSVLPFKYRHYIHKPVNMREFIDEHMELSHAMRSVYIESIMQHIKKFVANGEFFDIKVNTGVKVQVHGPSDMLSFLQHVSFVVSESYRKKIELPSGIRIGALYSIDFHTYADLINFIAFYEEKLRPILRKRIEDNSGNNLEQLRYKWLFYV